MSEELDRQIEAVLDKIRPFMQREGGDITYIGEKDGTVYVEMAGACSGCMYADADISAGVEIILMEEVPGIPRRHGPIPGPERKGRGGEKAIKDGRFAVAIAFFLETSHEKRQALRPALEEETSSDPFR